MIIGISGSVGTGKSIIAKKLASILNFELLHLNERVIDYKIENDEKLQTFDFDIDNFLDDFEDELKDKKNNNLIIESHFSHFISSKLINLLFIINRDLNSLKLEYEKRNYNKEKIADNLEVESFNLCFYEAEENNYTIIDKNTQIKSEFGNVILIDNNSSLDETVDKILKIIKENMN